MLPVPRLLGLAHHLPFRRPLAIPHTTFIYAPDHSKIDFDGVNDPVTAVEPAHEGQREAPRFLREWKNVLLAKEKYAVAALSKATVTLVSSRGAENTAQSTSI